MSEAIAIAAVHEIRPGRYPELDSRDLFRTIMEGAIREWGIGPRDIDGLMTTPMGDVSDHDTYAHDRLISDLALRVTFCETMNLGGCSHVAMVNRAAAAIRSGLCNSVLCVSGGMFMKPSAGGGELSASFVSDVSLEFPYGTFIPALYGLSASQYMAEHGVTAEDLARVAVSARKWAQLNPMARMHGKGELTIEEVLASRMICTPFHFLDCSFPSSGGGAVLVTRADQALTLTDRPAWVLGYGEAHLRGLVSDEGNLIETGATISGPRAFAEAGLTPADIDVAQIYDAFSSTPLILLENLGFCAPGGAPALVNSGACDPGGHLPMNTYGGLMSFGHTGEACGMSLLIEGARQAMGMAGERQVPNVRHSLIHAYGGMLYDHGTMILGVRP